MKLEHLEDLPSYVSCNKVRNQERDYKEEPLPYNKIIRFLHKNVGNHIDSVFSLFCKTEWIPKRHRTWKSFCHFVETNTFMRDKGVFYITDYWYSERSVKEENSRNFFYMNPVTRVVCHKPKTKTPSWRERELDKQRENFRFISKGVQLLRIDGVWYEVKFQVATTKFKYVYSTRKYEYVTLTEQEIDKLYTKPLDYTNRGSYRNISKRQLGYKELKKHNLKNI